MFRYLKKSKELFVRCGGVILLDISPEELEIPDLIVDKLQWVFVVDLVEESFEDAIEVGVILAVEEGKGSEELSQFSTSNPIVSLIVMKCATL